MYANPGIYFIGKLTLVNQRWTMTYYEELAETRFSCDDSTRLDQPHTTVTLTENKQTVLSQAQKFRKALRIAQFLMSLASEGGMRTFMTCLHQSEDVAEYWRHKEMVSNKLAQETSRERQGRETYRKSEGKIKNERGRNKEKVKKGEGEHKKWNTDESQEQEQHRKITISAPQ